MSGSQSQIVVTGAGLITALGSTPAAVWRAVEQGRCGMGTMSVMESALSPESVGGQAVDLPEDYLPSYPREVRYLRRAMSDALADAFADSKPSYPPERCATMIGTTLHGMRAGGDYLRSGDFSHLQRFLAGQTLDLATEDFPIHGLAATTCSACSSSLGSIALGITLLQSGKYDLVIAGGYDTISEYVYAGFNSLRLVAPGELRPFSRNRAGMKLAEGYGIVILERASDALQRGRAPLAAILGWGESADAHHLTQPHPQGAGASRAMLQALDRAGLTAADIHLIAAHATGTPDNDAAEYAAMSRVFGSELPHVPVVGFKSHLGHTLGGAGAVELILSIMAVNRQTIPPCANISSEECEFPHLNLATGAAKSTPIRAALNTSLGFGGANTSIIVGPASSVNESVSPSPLRDVFITGVGAVLPGMIGNDALADRFEHLQTPAWDQPVEQISDEQLEGLLNARRVRRMSQYVKLQLAAVNVAVQHAKITDPTAFAETCSVVLGTTHGSAGYSEIYYGQIVNEGIAAANPLLFAEGVPNAASAQLSLMLGVKGACQTLIGTRTAGLDALNLAAARIATGAWERAIIGASEERADVIQRAYEHCGLAAKENPSGPFSGGGGFVWGASGLAIVLESRESLDQRNGKPLARVKDWASAKVPRHQLGRAVTDILRQLGDVDAILSSASATWLDRAEETAIRSQNRGVVSATYGHLPELFSAGSLAGIAGIVLSRRTPRLLGCWPDSGSIRAADGTEHPTSFAAIVTDFSGCASGTRIELT